MYTWKYSSRLSRKQKKNDNKKEIKIIDKCCHMYLIRHINEGIINNHTSTLNHKIVYNPITPNTKTQSISFQTNIFYYHYHITLPSRIALNTYEDLFYLQYVIKVQLFEMSYQQQIEQSRQLASRMRNGTGAATLLTAINAPTHHMDALERFQKDFAIYQKDRRQEQKGKRRSELQRRRVEALERESKRWQAVQSYNNKVKERQQYSVNNHLLGKKRTANSNGLAYNPITLQYDRNPEGEKLKRLDEDARIRGFVRAHNMDNKGNSNYNPLNGERRLGIQALIPNELNDRYERKKTEHYDYMALKVPSSANENMRPNNYSKFY